MIIYKKKSIFPFTLNFLYFLFDGNEIFVITKGLACGYFGVLESKEDLPHQIFHYRPAAARLFCAAQRSDV